MHEFPRTDEKKLSFHGARLIRGRHRIHPYPAMLHPLLVNWLIDEYADADDLIFDPFCGSGVTLVESGIKGHGSVGFDINPLALLIAKTKTRTYQKERLLREFNDLKKTLYSSEKADIPQIKNAGYWYSESVINDLGRIRRVLKDKPYKYKDFFTISFAFICRNQSYTRKGEFKKIPNESGEIGECEERSIREVLFTYPRHDRSFSGNRRADVQEQAAAGQYGKQDSLEYQI